jgi:hypothetical protein
VRFAYAGRTGRVVRPQCFLDDAIL